ncbi:MAG: glycosyltransferase [Bryobacterales bacterium]|nr:glycosyltransferase [Bryobacterales bacterium]
MAGLIRFLRALPLLLISPLLLVLSVLALAVGDLLWLLRRNAAAPPADEPPARDAASVVIPNWNGRDLLERYLPSVIEALAGNPANEIIVVDNASTDGSVDLLRRHFPQVRVLPLDRNLGFGGGSNTGVREARNDIVVLLNSDMRVDRGFLQPLLDCFADETVFAASCQIFLSDPNRVREETGLTQAWWEDGTLRVRHRADPAVTRPYPCFYGGGGSCAFDRRKFLELGGFDRLYEPFYLEDTDLGYRAWKRGWKVFYQPASVVFHEHRGTIGKHFRPEHIQAVLKKNYILFCWKNIHEWPRLASHFLFLYGSVLVSVFFGDEPLRANLQAFWRAFTQLPGAVAARLKARRQAEASDTEAFLLPLGGYFRDRFQTVNPAGRLRVLFVSPYPICPPVHGGGVFMYQTLRELSRLAEVHVVALLDYDHQVELNRELATFCASAEFLVRMEGRTRHLASMVPHAVREFQNDDLAWLIHRIIYMQGIDVVQLEYTPLAQYAAGFRQLACVLFEHDIYFQSIARGLPYMAGWAEKIQARFEYLRALRYELGILDRFDRVQVCTTENRRYLASFAPRLAPLLQDGLRAGIDTSRYAFCPWARDPCTMLFLGSFRHTPNQVALDWFIRGVLPLILRKRPEARLVVVGSDAPPEHLYADYAAALEFRGFVEDIREPLTRFSVFVCPVRSGSGVRVKLLEAFAAGIPVVSTRIGAEGLEYRNGRFCLLADSPEAFAEAVLQVFENPQAAAEMAIRAREEVAANWDMAVITRKLEASYREVLEEKAGRTSGRDALKTVSATGTS